MGVAGAVAGNIMLLAAALYAGEFTGIEENLATLFRWVSFGPALPAVLYSAMPFYRGAVAGLRARMLHMDLPISLGIIAAMTVSVVATVQNRGEARRRQFIGLDLSAVGWPDAAQVGRRRGRRMPRRR